MTGPRIQGRRGIQRAGDEHQPVGHNRRSLNARSTELERPLRRQFRNVGWSDSLQAAVMRAAEISPIRQPVLWFSRGVLQPVKADVEVARRLPRGMTRFECAGRSEEGEDVATLRCRQCPDTLRSL